MTQALPIGACTTVAELLTARAAATPEAAAFVEQDAQGRWQATDWQTFHTEVSRLGRGLIAAGAAAGDRLALIAPVSRQWELLHHAALSVGCVVVGLDAHDLPRRLALMIDKAEVRLLACADPDLLARIDSPRVHQAVLRIRLHSPGAGADATTPPGWTDLAALARLGAAVGTPPAAPRADDPATILFTSGTTGAPKGILYRHGQLVLAVEAIQQAFDFVSPQGHLLCWLPLSNLFQRVVNLAAVRSGTATHLLPDPRRVMEVVAEVAPDVFIGVPRFYEKLLQGLNARLDQSPWPVRRLARAAWQIGRRYRSAQRQQQPIGNWLRWQHALADRLVLSRIRAVMGHRLTCLVSGSAPAPRHLLEELHALGWLVLEAYGLSENVMPMTMNRVGRWRFGTVGHPMPGNDIRIDEDGVLSVRGPGVFQGYLGESDAAGEPGPTPLDAQGYFRTGDIGRFDGDGFLVLHGRANELIKTSTGRRVAPAPIEAALTSVQGIDQALVVGDGRKHLVALCTLAEGADRTRLQAALVAALADTAPNDRPRAVGLLDHPFSLADGDLTPNLKLRRATIIARQAATIDALYARLEQAPGGDLLLM